MRCALVGHRGNLVTSDIGRARRPCLVIIGVFARGIGLRGRAAHGGPDGRFPEIGGWCWSGGPAAGDAGPGVEAAGGLELFGFCVQLAGSLWVSVAEQTGELVGGGGDVDR